MILNKNPTVILQPLRLLKAYFVLWLFCFLQSIWPSDQSTSRDRKQFEHSTQVLKHSLPRPGQGTFPPRSTKPEILRAPWSQVAMLLYYLYPNPNTPFFSGASRTSVL